MVYTSLFFLVGLPTFLCFFDERASLFNYIHNKELSYHSLSHLRQNMPLLFFFAEWTNRRSSLSGIPLSGSTSSTRIVFLLLFFFFFLVETGPSRDETRKKGLMHIECTLPFMITLKSAKTTQEDYWHLIHLGNSETTNLFEKDSNSCHRINWVSFSSILSSSFLFPRGTSLLEIRRDSNGILRFYFFFLKRIVIFFF